MSTSFEVYPRSNYLPTINELIELSNKKINEFLRCYGMEYYNVSLEAFLVYKHEKEMPLNCQSLLSKPEEYHNLGFGLKNINGAFWLYFHDVDDLTKECWEEEIKTKETNIDKCLLVRDSLGIGYYWDFTRYAGQPGIINLSYGMAAASLAELTNGFIYSSDSAWDYDLFPVDSIEFCKSYLRARYTDKNDYKKFAEDSLAWMREKLK